MKEDPIIMMVREANCMVSVILRDVEQKRIAGLSDVERSLVITHVSLMVRGVLAAIRGSH